MSEFVGTLSKRITLQQRTRTPDGAGGETGEWQDVDQLWAAVELMRPSRQQIAARDTQSVSARITFRKRVDVVPGMRFSYNKQGFVIMTLFEEGEVLEADCVAAPELE